jgi:histidyl-tRNA synthetase
MIRAITGTHDILPDEIAAWHGVEAEARSRFARYGDREVRMPIFVQPRALPADPLLEHLKEKIHG